MIDRNPHSKLGRALRSSHRFVVLFVAAVCCWPHPAPAQRRSPLAPPPNWADLEAYHGTITREEFVRLLEHVYAPGGAARGLIEPAPEAAVISASLAPATQVRVRFAADRADARKATRFWRAAAELGPAPPERPLEGLTVALDPGHLGGPWAKMEERWYRIGDSQPVVEGEMTLRVAKRLGPLLQQLGARVLSVRDQLGPVTADRPETLQDAARAELERLGIHDPKSSYDASKPEDPGRSQTLQWQSELLFYRISEIRRRAQLVNEELKPDLVICIHFNAESWGGDPTHPQFVPRNHLHLLINGCYTADELRLDDQRHDLLQKLFGQTHAEELAVAESVAASMGSATGLPPYEYTTPNARKVEGSRYVWERNLLANRLYQAPVIFLEPYVMNCREIWERVQAGDYEGEREVAGKLRRNLYREYAEGVAEGLREYYRAARPPTAKVAAPQ